MLEFKRVNEGLLYPVDQLLGLLPWFADESDPRPAAQQFGAKYQGGWHPLPGFAFHTVSRKLKYPGDPPMNPVAEAKLRDETILLYPGDWVLILQPNGDFEVSRMD